MDDNRYGQFRVSKIDEIEFDVADDDHDATVMRLFLESRVGDQIVLEIPHEMWTEIYAALTAAMKKFPGGGLQQ
jgi:hypothetical protein